MPHRSRHWRNAARLFTFDARHIKPCATKRLSNVCGCCGTGADNQYRHSSNCKSSLADLPGTYADLLHCWQMGYTCQEVAFTSLPPENGVAYLMGRELRGLPDSHAYSPADSSEPVIGAIVQSYA